MFKLIFNKFKNNKSSKANKIAALIKEKSLKVADFFDEKIAAAQEEYETIKTKTKDLRTTNFNLGLKHLQKGNLFDACLRFQIITKFWPDYYDAYFYYAYCLTLRNRPGKAQTVLQELLNKKPDFHPAAQDLLDHINKYLANELH